jgi:beta-galactosidase/beta-glucuronidase
MVTATLVNAAVTSATTHATVHFDLFDADDKPAGSGIAQAVTIKPASSKSTPSTVTTAVVTIAVASAELWSVARPYLYTLRTSVSGGDVMNTTMGIYSTKWTGDQGFFLNNQHVKIRGFCNHESFGGVGMAIPDRVNLFRAQALRSVGGNGWRMSHNPVTPGLYDILDRVGVVAMDESRILGTDPISIMNMGAMVKRDRNHASVVIWSYCNEGGCGSGGAGFRNITLKYDTSRPTLGNRAGFGDDGSTDVAGFSHSRGDVFDDYHAKHPTKPKFASECCSCSSQRSSLDGETNGGKLNASNDGNIDDGTLALSCTASQSNDSNGRPFMAGTMVWTLFDVSELRSRCSTYT